MVRTLARLIRRQDGGVLVYLGVSFAVLMGVAGLAVDVSVWHAEKRTSQSIGDAAAMAGSQEIRRRYAAAQVSTVAEAEATANGFRAQALFPSDYDTIVVNNPPATGDYTTDADAVEVIITRPAEVLISSLVYSGDVQVVARAVATLVIGGTGCVISLNETASQAIDMAGTTDLDLNCGLESNSTAGDAIAVRGAACLDTPAVISAGGTNFNGCVTTGSTETNATTSGDPLALQLPPAIPAACHPDGPVVVDAGATETLNADFRFCQGILIEAGATVDFDPGTYVIMDDGVTFKDSTIYGEDVSFYFAPPGDTDNLLTIEATADVELHAPDETGELPGILFYSDRAHVAVAHVIAGGASTILDGIMYFPNDTVTVAGGSGALNTMIISDTVTFTGNTTINSLPSAATFANKLIKSAKLVE